MKFTPENFHELHVLMLYHTSTALDGIKIHKTADPEVIAAGQRLFDDGFISRSDGGYLTARGSEAAEHAHLLLSMLNGSD